MLRLKCPKCKKFIEVFPEQDENIYQYTKCENCETSIEYGIVLEIVIDEVNIHNPKGREQNEI